MSTIAAAKRASFLELFFDLVFVFAVTQIARLLHSDHSLEGWISAGFVMWLVWWAWSQYTWAANAIDIERRPVRVALLAVAGAMLVAAIAIPGALGGTGAWFAVPYVAVRLGGLALYWVGVRRDAAYRAALAGYLPGALVGPALVLAGGFAPEDARPWFLGAAVVADIVSVILAGRGEFAVSATHFAERHALFVIIALGESIIAVGLVASEIGPSAALIATVLAAFAVTATLWWAYFDWVHGAAEHRLASEPDPRRRGRLARDIFTFAHLPIVAGTVVFAVGVEEAVAHPGDPLDSFGRLAVALGIGLFLTGFIAGNARTARALLAERAVAGVAIVGVALFLAGTVDALATVIVVAVILVAAVAMENARRRPRMAAH